MSAARRDALCRVPVFPCTIRHSGPRGTVALRNRFTLTLCRWARGGFQRSNRRSVWHRRSRLRPARLREGSAHGAHAGLRNEPNESEVLCRAAPCTGNVGYASAAKRAIVAPALASAPAGLGGVRQGRSLHPDGAGPSRGEPPGRARACPDSGPFTRRPCGGRACPDVLPGQPRGVAPTGAPGICHPQISVLCRRRLGGVDVLDSRR